MAKPGSQINNSSNSKGNSTRAALATSTLYLASDLSLPIDAATRTFALIGQKGSGKSYNTGVLAEELRKAGVQVIIIDPLDVFWGLRLSADGKHEGLDFVLFGGSHADVPLSADAGEFVADLIVDEGISAVLSLRHLSKAQARRFVTEFAARLYHRKGDPAYRSPLHLIIDEADLYAPQRATGMTEAMVETIDDLVRRGRTSGIGTTLLTQRPAAIAKDVLTQAEILICLRTVAPQDQKAISDWIQANDPEGKRGDVMGSLASMPVGTGWVWSPAWLNILKQVHFRRRFTFDSSATPTFDSGTILTAPMAPADLARVRQLLLAYENDTITPGEVEKRSTKVDGKNFRRVEHMTLPRSAPIQQHGNKSQPSVPPVQSHSVIEYRDREIRIPVEIPMPVMVPGPQALDELEEIGNQLVEAANKLIAEGNALLAKGKHLLDMARFGKSDAKQLEEQRVRALATVENMSRPQHATPPAPSTPGHDARANTRLIVPGHRAIENIGIVDARIANTDTGLQVKPVRRSRSRSRRGRLQNDALNTQLINGPGSEEGPTASSTRSGKHRILSALYQFYPRYLTKRQLAYLTQLSMKGGTWGDYIKQLKIAGLIEELQGDLRITTTGAKDFGGFGNHRTLTGEERQQVWRAALPGRSREMFDLVIAAYPNWVSREQLASATDLTASGGTFGSYVGTLRTNGLAEVSRTEGVRATRELFED